jgi:uncharacterized protein (TIGR02597 family)
MSISFSQLPNRPALFRPFARRVAVGLLVLAASSAITVASTSLATAPVGVFTVAIAAGTGTGSALSTVSFPLSVRAGFSGAMAGRITGVTASTISNSSAGWAAGELSSAEAPCLLEITSGAAAGRTWLVSTAAANTASTVTLDAEESALVDLTTLGITTGETGGDTYRILACDTIASVFGSPETTGVLGGTSASSADYIQVLVQGAWLRYYYSTTYSSWRRVGVNTLADNIPLRPDTLILYSRLGSTAMSLPLFGDVPTVERQALIRPSGVTALATGWPLSTTLAASGIPSIAGWNAASTLAASDRIWLLVTGAWQRYYYNGSGWKRVGPNTASDAIAIPAGAGVLLEKISASTSASVLKQAVPYDL